MVGPGNKKTFQLAGAFPKLVSSTGALGREVWLPHIGVYSTQERVCHRKLGIDFDGALEKRDRASVVLGEPHLQGGGVQLPGFERWCAGLGELDRVLLDAG